MYLYFLSRIRLFILAILSLFFISVSLEAQVCNLSQLPANLQNGLVAWYPFCGNANDASGNGNNGSVNGATLTNSRFGLSNNAYSFNPGNFINLPTSLTWTNVQGLTFSAWAKFNTLVSTAGAGNTIFDIADGPVNNQWPFRYYIVQDVNKIHFGLEGTGASGGFRVSSSTVNSGQWYHVVGVINNNQANLYLNGSLVSTSSISLSTFSLGTGVINSKRFGLDPNTSTNPLNGSIDEVIIYRRALSSCEVTQLYNATINNIPGQGGFAFNPISDTTSQCGTSKILDAGVGYNSYLWNTGATSQTITATTGGFYKVTVSNAAGCTGSDSTLLSLVNANILNNDTTICKGSSITLSIDSLFPGFTAIDGDGNLYETISIGAQTWLKSNLRTTKFSNGDIISNLSQINLWSVTNTPAWVYYNNDPLYNSTYGKLYNWYVASDSRNACPSGWRVSTDADWNTLTRYLDPLADTICSNCGASSIVAGYLKTTGTLLWDPPNVGATNSYGFSSVPGGALILPGTFQYLGYSSNYWTSTLFASDNAYFRNNVAVSAAIWRGQQVGNVRAGLSIRCIRNTNISGPIITWSTGATTNSITVNPTQTTRYYVTVTDGITTCTDSVLVTISNVDTSLTVLDPAQICSNGGAVRMRAGTASSYQWLKNGTAIAGATAQNYSATSTGSYRVALVNSLGCRDTSRTIQITIAPQPVAAFSPNAIAQCLAGNNFFFTNNSIISNGTLSYRWDLGDGTILSTANATHVYTAPGNYTVKLVVTSNIGCADSTIQVISVNPMPIAGFTINNNVQCINANSFQFTNTSTLAAGSFSAAWYFGDGGTANTLNSLHTYAISGTYSVKLVVTSQAGCKDSIVRTVTVNPKPSVAFTVSPAGQCLAGNNFIFTNNSTITSGSLTHYWKFGDGGTATSANATHSYATGGNYTVWLITTSDNGCKDSSSRIVTVNPQPVAGFTINNGSQCINGNAFVFTSTSTISSGAFNCYWYFGDGGTANTPTTTHSYLTAGSYSVKLVVTSNNGCRDSITQSVIVFPKPSVGFTVNNSAQCLNGNNFMFTNSSTIPSGTLGYFWDFGDGGTASTTNPSYSYSADGSFVVKLVAISNNGCRDSAGTLVTVYPKPVPGFTVNASHQCYTGNSFQFTNSSLITNGSMSYFWDFGDGVNAASASASHSYTAPGTYQVKLIATSNNGCRDSISRTVIVDASPAAIFSVNQATQCLDANLYVFTNNSTLSSGTMQYLWDFGDGIGTSSVRNPSYSYAAPGIYTVTLTCTSNFNCSSTLSMQVIVRPTPSGSIYTPGSTVICEGGFINLYATGGDTYQWLLNSIPVSGAVSANFVATDPGTYSVVLSNNYGCAALASNSVLLSKVFQPVVDFRYDSYCVGELSNFLNLTDTSRTGRVGYAWDFGDTSFAYTWDASHIYRNRGSYSVRLTVTPLDCPNLSSSISKNISFQDPPASLRYNPVNAVSGKDLSLSARIFNGASYAWQPSAGLSNPGIRDPLFNYTREQQYLIRITTAAGCKVVDTLLVRIFSNRDIYVPDVFSPNGDGRNDKLAPLLVGINELKVFRVYDRWGQLMFQTSRAGEGWDGSFRGQKQTMETYTWIVEARDTDGVLIQKRGSSILIR